jgi:hypothetical protein
MSQQPSAVINAYLRKLVVLKRQPYNVWKDTELPYPKKAIQKAILEELTLVDGKSPTEKNKELRRALVLSYIDLAYFIPPDDAQLLIQSEKLIFKMTEKRSHGQSHTEDEYQRLSLYEEPAMRLRERIVQEERLRIAEVAMYNAGGSLELGENGVTLRFPAPIKLS